jgi:uncharacterized protein (TIGR02453 family)
MSTSPNLQSALQFLDELGQNNYKAWFDEHRPAYESAREAFYRLVDEIIDEFRGPDHLQGLTAKDCTARIFRDIRFSKDKTPYKTNFAAHVTPGGWRADRLGYYISFAPKGQSIVAGGLHNPTPEQLTRFRDAIDRDAAPLKAVLEAPDFAAAFGSIDGERLKTAPKGYDPTHPDIALLQLKQITVVHTFPDPEVLASDFAAQIIALCKVMRPFLDYLNVVLI